MSSIMSNTASIAALHTLRGIEIDLEKTHDKVSSGLRISTAENNAAYWSIATTMRSDDKSLASVEDALALGAATVDTAYAGMEYAVDVMTEIKAKLVMAREPGVDREKIDKELTQLKSQLSSITESASFSGENWLLVEDGMQQTTSVVGSFVRGGDGMITVETLDYERWPSAASGTPRALIDNSAFSAGGELGILTSTQFAVNAGAAQNYALVINQSNSAGAVEIKLTSTTTEDEVEDMLSTVDAMLEQMIDTGGDLGAMSTRIKLQSEFVIDLRDSVAKGVGLLVDADMNTESMRIKALQTQQQLAITTLPIANENAQNILSLFR